MSRNNASGSSEQHQGASTSDAGTEAVGATENHAVVGPYSAQPQQMHSTGNNQQRQPARPPLYVRLVPDAEQQRQQPTSSAANQASSMHSSNPYHVDQDTPVSNELDLDRALLSQRRPSSSSSRPVTYKEATVDDHPIPPPLGSSSSSSQLVGFEASDPQQQYAASNQLEIDDVKVPDFDLDDPSHPHHQQQQQQHSGPGSSSSSGLGQAAAAAAATKQQQWQRLPKLLGRPVGGGMPDFPSGELDLVKHLNLDGIFLQNKASVTHDADGSTDQQQQQQLDTPTPGLPHPTSTRHPGSKSSSSSSRKHQKQQQQQEPKQKYSQPRPHPLYLKPRHIKTHFKTTTSDGWKLHLIRTQVLNVPPKQHHPVILCPGLGSSGAYSFDLSPNVSLADYLAGKGWDVWTCELRGNGASDKPSIFSTRSRWWTIDDYVEKDVPTVIRFVLKETHSQQVHFLGHSMGGMILCGVMARVDHTTAKIRSCIAVGSGLFLEDSWWRLFDRFKFASHAFWILPSGTLLRTYGRLMFGPWAIPYIDMLYFWPTNVDPQVGRAMMRRNFSNISVGVIRQISSAFQPKGLASADKKMIYADPGRLSKVRAPALFMVGDRDRMCPAEGARKTWQMFGSPQKRFVCLGPAAGFSDHYGHFDILMGKRVEREVFPLLHDFLLQHDAPQPRPRL